MTRPFMEIEIDDRQVLDALNQLISRSEDLSPAMQEISGLLARSTERAFQEQRDPETGVPWQPLKPSTVEQREKAGRGSTPILQVHGQLAASIQQDYGPDYAAAGTNHPPGRTHQFGASQGEYGVFSLIATRAVIPIPWGDVPARRFLGIGPEDRGEILEILTRYLDAG